MNRNDKTSERDEVVTYFNNFDTQKDGILDFREFSELVSMIGYEFSHTELKEGFDRVDTDKNNQIDFDEFMRWWGQNN